ncbi:hypothetical protein DUNSADRAFT_6086 [Dunaliella salina]|uniref:Uncharacterized protein n=1 Tax=Dunaliella salina TaxID=3046 RepID=A0ABQ7H6Y6_DUNSA|nr:hypothetical protein DUNSADRAFT_6086 [Dunaliella salina]|eukprot:KAF5842617.1 hypothetical protein DUNSADRAFT_6086 [Dunaliella salina]
MSVESVKDDAVGTNKLGMQAGLFTRAQTADNRGESMMAKHQNALQQEKEDQAMDQMVTMLPHLGPAVKALALRETAFSVQDAVRMLELFQSQNQERLSAIHKRRAELKSAEEKAAKDTQRGGDEDSASGSSSGGSESESDSGNGSDSDHSTKKRKHKHSKSSHKKKAKHNKKEKKAKKHKHSKHKKHKRSKKAEEEAKPADNYGRFGIIREVDASTKRSEFILWALEVKQKDPELMMKNDERELFRDFMEDYNTGTMPHRKYYNLEIYEREKAAKRGGKMTANVRKAMGVLDDEEALRRQRADAATDAGGCGCIWVWVGMLVAIKKQGLMRLQMQIAYKTGDTKKAEQLQRQLMPDEEKEAKGIRVRPAAGARSGPIPQVMK